MLPKRQFFKFAALGSPHLYFSQNNLDKIIYRLVATCFSKKVSGKFIRKNVLAENIYDSLELFQMSLYIIKELLFSSLLISL